jgi:hypothetical protein
VDVEESIFQLPLRKRRLARQRRQEQLAAPPGVEEAYKAAQAKVAKKSGMSWW